MGISDDKTKSVIIVGEIYNNRTKMIGRDMLLYQRLYVLRDSYLLNDLLPYAAERVSGKRDAAVQT